jgi:hypothetical protein
MEPERRGHERTDLPIRPIVLGAIALTVLAAAIQGILVLQFEGLRRGRIREVPPPPPMAAAAPEAPPAPRLQASPTSDLAALRAEEQTVLETYGWQDRNTGVVRIPIARAMALVVEGR